jgi:hypothetical protein
VGHESPLAVGRIAAQGEHIVDPHLLVAADLPEQVLDGRVAAGEVGHGQQAGLAADAFHQCHGAIVAAAAARAVGDGDECRSQVAQRRDGGEQAVGPLVVAGREELEREEGIAPREQAVDAHGR